MSSLCRLPQGEGSNIRRPLRHLMRMATFRSSMRASAIPARLLAIADLTMALIGSIQFQVVTHQELQHVSQAVEFVACHSQQMSIALQDLESDHHLGSIRTAITELMTHYVISQQRNTHNAAIASDEVEDKRPLVELF
jgi:hypothetical protein